MPATTEIQRPVADGSGAPESPPAIVSSSRASWLSRYSGLVILLALIVLFGILEPSTFLTTDTLRSILGDQAITAMMALALLLPLAGGVFDLSIAGGMGVSIMLVGDAPAHRGPWGVSI